MAEQPRGRSGRKRTSKASQQNDAAGQPPRPDVPSSGNGDAPLADGNHATPAGKRPPRVRVDAPGKTVSGSGAGAASAKKTSAAGKAAKGAVKAGKGVAKAGKMVKNPKAALNPANILKRGAQKRKAAAKAAKAAAKPDGGKESAGKKVGKAVGKRLLAAGKKLAKTAVKKTAKAAWKGIKKVGKKIGQEGIKSIATFLFSNPIGWLTLGVLLLLGVLLGFMCSAALHDIRPVDNTVAVPAGDARLSVEEARIAAVERDNEAGWTALRDDTPPERLAEVLAEETRKAGAEMTLPPQLVRFLEPSPMLVTGANRWCACADGTCEFVNVVGERVDPDTGDTEFYKQRSRTRRQRGGKIYPAVVGTDVTLTLDAPEELDLPFGWYHTSIGTVDTPVAVGDERAAKEQIGCHALAASLLLWQTPNLEAIARTTFPTDPTLFDPTHEDYEHIHPQLPDDAPSYQQTLVDMLGPLRRRSSDWPGWWWLRSAALLADDDLFHVNDTCALQGWVVESGRAFNPVPTSALAVELADEKTKLIEGDNVDAGKFVVFTECQPHNRIIALVLHEHTKRGDWCVNRKQQLDELWKVHYLMAKAHNTLIGAYKRKFVLEERLEPLLKQWRDIVDSQQDITDAAKDDLNESYNEWMRNRSGGDPDYDDGLPDAAFQHSDGVSGWLNEEHDNGWMNDTSLRTDVEAFELAQEHQDDADTNDGVNLVPDELLEDMVAVEGELAVITDEEIPTAQKTWQNARSVRAAIYDRIGAWRPLWEHCTPSDEVADDITSFTARELGASPLPTAARMLIAVDTRTQSSVSVPPREARFTGVDDIESYEVVPLLRTATQLGWLWSDEPRFETRFTAAQSDEVLHEEWPQFCDFYQRRNRDTGEPEGPRYHRWRTGNWEDACSRVQVKHIPYDWLLSMDDKLCPSARVRDGSSGIQRFIDAAYPELDPDLTVSVYRNRVRINRVHPCLHADAVALVAGLNALGVTSLKGFQASGAGDPRFVGGGWRSADDQKKICANWERGGDDQGRKRCGSGVPVAWPGTSRHNYGFAVDFTWKPPSFGYRCDWYNFGCHWGKILGTATQWVKGVLQGVRNFIRGNPDPRPDDADCWLPEPFFDAHVAQLPTEQGVKDSETSTLLNPVIKCDALLSPLLPSDIEAGSPEQQPGAPSSGGTEHCHHEASTGDDPCEPEDTLCDEHPDDLADSPDTSTLRDHYRSLCFEALWLLHDAVNLLPYGRHRASARVDRPGRSSQGEPWHWSIDGR